MAKLNLGKLFGTLGKIPNINDILIRNKEVCCKTDSNDYLYIDLSNLDDKSIADNMTLVDFKIKHKTIKILTDNFTKDVEFVEDDTNVSFIFSDSKAYTSRIPAIINNEFVIDEWNSLLSNDPLGTITITAADFEKISKLVDIYNATPWLIKEDGKLFIDVESSNKNESIKIPLNNVDIDVNLFEDKLKIQKILFLYPFEKDVVISFIKQDNKFIAKCDSSIDDRSVSYMFFTTSSMYYDVDIDISNINLDMF